MIGFTMRGPGQSSASPLTRLAPLVRAVLLSATVAGCDMHHGGSLAGRASDEWTRSYTLQDGGEFQVVGGMGTIDVQGGSGSTIEVKAERVVRAATDATARSLPSRVRISEDAAFDKIVLRTEGLGGIIIGVEVEVNFHITVPSSTRLRLRSAGGDITVANMDGAVVASSTNGAVSGNGLRGGVDARSTNGNVTVELASVSRDPVDLRAVNGQVSLTVPAAANANVEANCTNGSIDVSGLPLELTGEQTKRRTRGRLNDGGTPIELTTTNGNIHIRGTS
jgi:hypothetical protein